jgi:hypothetical protein
LLGLGIDCQQEKLNRERGDSIILQVKMDQEGNLLQKIIRREISSKRSRYLQRKIVDLGLVIIS